MHKTSTLSSSQVRQEAVAHRIERELIPQPARQQEVFYSHTVAMPSGATTVRTSQVREGEVIKGTS